MSAGGIRNQQGGIRVSIDASRTRQTPKTDFGSVMKSGLSRGADAVMDAGKLAAPFIPGGAIVSAAITGMGNLKSASGAMNAQGGSNATSLARSGTGASTGGLSGGGTVGGASAGGAFANVENLAAGGSESAQMMMATKQMQEMNQSFNLQYLQLQQKMQGDNRQFTLMSNIMKTKHDTAKNAINNVR